MQIRPVASPADLRRFIQLPYRLYRDDPNWVPPLRSEQRAQFDRRRNPMLAHCRAAMYLLWDGDDVVGRIVAFVDEIAVAAWGEPIGLFGSFECAAGSQGASLLLGAARDWLYRQGMRAMRGPWSLTSQEWGLVVDGFTPPPVLMAPYNPPHYVDLLVEFGLAKVKDLLVYYADVAEGYVIPHRYLTLTDRVQQRYGIRVRSVDMSRLGDEVATLMELSNEAIGDNWGYYPVTDAESQAMAKDLRQIIHPQAVLIAEDRSGTPIGFAIALPDINRLLRGLNGRLFPLGWAKLLWGLPGLHDYRIWALGVVPAYQGKAVDALLYRRLYEALYHPGLRVEVNYVLEDNVRMNNALQNLAVKPLRRYRVYEMPIAS